MPLSNFALIACYCTRIARNFEATVIREVYGMSRIPNNHLEKEPFFNHPNETACQLPTKALLRYIHFMLFPNFFVCHWLVYGDRSTTGI